MQEKLNKKFPKNKGERMCYMKKYVSDYLNKGVKGHFNYDFVDVIVNDDNLLFIDPMLICSVVNKKDTISNDFLAETNSYAC